MKTVGNFLTILFTIFLPVLTILLVIGVPAVVKAALILMYSYCLYQLLKYVILARILVWNGYCYWYLKRLLSQREFAALIYSLSNQDHLRLKNRISRQEYQKVFRIIPEDNQKAIQKHQQTEFEKHLVVMQHVIHL